MSDYSTLESRIEDRVFVITLTRADEYNTITPFQDYGSRPKGGGRDPA